MPLESSDQVNEASTLLTLEGLGVPPYSARGLTQSLSPIDAASQTRRTINGSLKNLAVTQFQKYKSTITGKDVDPPAVSGRWPGQIVTVECIPELCYRTADGPVPDRAAVSGSERVSGDFTFFRPVLTMRVLSFEWELDEWPHNGTWSMELEEV